MKVTVKDCLKLEVFKEAKLIAGSRGVKNRVKGVTVLENAEISDIAGYIAHKEELVITAFFSIRNDIQKQCAVVEELARNENSALVLFYVGRVLKDISKELIKAADRACLPLIIMPNLPEPSYAEVITKVVENILCTEQLDDTTERDARSEFIKALRRGNESLAYKLKDEALIKGEEILSVFFARGIEKEDAFKEIAEFEKREKFQIIKITEGDETFGMILSELQGVEEMDAEQRAKCIALFNKLKEEKTVRIFHVTGVNGIEGVVDAYRLISETWSFVQNVFPYKRVFTKYELALVNNCINIQLQGGYVKKNYMELLEPFKEAGESKGRQLLETLETFVLDAGMNSAKTSVFMGIHTNTVQYRLKRINDVLGVEITGNRVIPGLTIALALKRLERVVS